MPETPGPSQPGASARTGERFSAVMLQTFVICAILLIPLAYATVPPLQDYPNHLARMFVITAIDHDADLQRFYAIDWALIPNLIMDVIVPFLARSVDVYVAGRLFIATTFVLLLTGPVMVHRAFYGRWSAWPLVGGIFTYNGFLFLGLMNYLFGVGVAVWALAGWIALRERSWGVRVAFGVAVVLVLYVCHLYAVGVYALGLTAYEGWRRFGLRDWRLATLLKDAAAFLLPFAPAVLLLLRSPTWGLAAQYEWASQGKIDGIANLVSVYSDVADFLVIGLLGLALSVAARRGVLRMHAVGYVVLALGLVAFMAMPRLFFGSWLADQRLPIAILELALGFAHLEPKGAADRSSQYAVLVALLVLRVVDVSANWIPLSHALDEARKASREMPRGARVMVATADETSIEPALNDAMYHAASLAVIERSALVSRIFNIPGKQILSTRAPYRDHVDNEDGDTPTISRILHATDSPASDGPQYWDGWALNFDYLFMSGTERGAPNPDPDVLALVHDGDGFQLYRILPAPSVD